MRPAAAISLFLMLAAAGGGPAHAQTGKADRQNLRVDSLARSAEEADPGSNDLRRRFIKNAEAAAVQEELDPASAEYFAYLRANLQAYARSGSSAKLRSLRNRRDGEVVRFVDKPAPKDYFDSDPTVQRNMRAFMRDVKNGVRVIGGSKAGAKTFPHTVGLRIYENGLGTRQVCTGVLVHRRAVLTAGHCVCDLQLDIFAANLRVVFGEKLPWSEAELPPSTRGITQGGIKLLLPDFCRHLNANNQVWKGFDLALLQLDKPAHASIKVTEAFSPHAYLSPMSHSLTVVGFGISDQTDFDIRSPDKIQATIPIASRLCDGRDNRTLATLCASGREMVLADWNFRGRDTCNGDSGGPAYLFDRGRYDIVGITSRGLNPSGKCGTGGIYTLVSPQVTSWIDGIMSAAPDSQTQASQ